MISEQPCLVLLELQIASSSIDVPTKNFFETCVAHTLSAYRKRGELTIRLVDRDEACDLNRRWRGKNAATNVLSFPAKDVEHAAPDLLGDLALCVPVVHAEAQARGISPEAHWAHLVVHGVLHLLGFDHEEESKAQEMEDVERAVLSEMGYVDPYAA